ncbi:unnamed protein product [Heligmosomoides polygyrus]|uniref:DUF4283 domain-containing protein n=1 Tax=Heligmosomoides polygyrus TaxID=6339 RepID=A0A183G887_HELPZ|nr:unnamed protein product [Heligmosomoides polygyrus]
MKETEYLTTDVTESSSIKVNGIQLQRTSVFMYLGSAVASDGNLIIEVNSREATRALEVKNLWNCRPSGSNVRCGVLACDEGNGKSNQRRGDEESALGGRSHAHGLRNPKIRNDAIRQKFNVAPIADKMREARLRWHGRVLRGKEDSVRKIGLELEVSGKRP